MPHSCGHTHARRPRHAFEAAKEGAQTDAAAIPAGRAATVRRPTHEEIAALAYSYWETRGRAGGSAMEDWLRAERELAH